LIDFSIYAFVMNHESKWKTGFFVAVLANQT